MSLCWLHLRTVWKLDPYQVWQNIMPDLDPSCWTLWWYSLKVLLKMLILKTYQQMPKILKNYPACKELQVGIYAKAGTWYGLWREKSLFKAIWGQQRHRPACASAQSDQHLCYSLIGKYHIQTCCERNFNFLATLCSWAGWFESHFIGDPKDRFSSVTAHMDFFFV